MEKAIRDKLKLQMGQNQPKKEPKGIVIKASTRIDEKENSDLEDDDFFDEEAQKILNRMKIEQIDAFN